MKNLKKMLAVLLCLITIFSMISITASAATSGGSSSSSIILSTKANYFYPGASSITLKQTKQTLTYKSLYSNKTKAKTGYYGCYNITVWNVTKQTRSYSTWYGGQTKKISLDPNCNYKITISYNPTATIMFTSQPTGYSYKSSSGPSWKVSSTWKLSYYW